MQRGRLPVVLILGTMGSRLFCRSASRTRAWVPTRPVSAYADLNHLQCDEDGVPTSQLDTAGCLDQWPLDYVGPLRKRLAKDGFSVLPFAYDWRQSHFVSARAFADWIDDRRLDQFNVIGISTGGLIATQYARMGLGAKIRKFISIGTPFLGMPRALANLHTGAVIHRVADLFLARKIRSLIRTFPSVYEVIPSASYFYGANGHYVEADDQPLTSHRDTCAFLESQNELSAQLVRAGSEFLSQLAPEQALRDVDTAYIVGTGRPTPARIIYRHSGQIRVYRQAFGDGSVPARSQTIGGQNETLHPGQSYQFQGVHRTMHLDPPIMEHIATILQET